MEINVVTYHEQKGKEECVICLDEVEIEWRDLECQHRYHKQCIDNWIRVSARCPLCMKTIKNNKIESINNNNMIEEAQYIAIRRYIIFICIIVCVIIIMVICSS
jgi:hypothetical protein